jgi:hypothetical protein
MFDPRREPLREPHSNEAAAIHIEHLLQLDDLANSLVTPTSSTSTSTGGAPLSLDMHIGTTSRPSGDSSRGVPEEEEVVEEARPPRPYEATKFNMVLLVLILAAASIICTTVTIAFNV